MEKELIIALGPTEVEIALLEDKRLAELHYQKNNSNFSVGDIFLGKIIKTMPGLNACFVDIGHKKEAFLHYSDLGPKVKSLMKYSNGVISGGLNKFTLEDFKYEEEILKSGKIVEVFPKRQPIVVQILKEPISTKGPRLSCELTIPGRFVVLTPFSNVIAVSKKIANQEERKRLHKMAESIKPKNFGIILRTAAEGKNTADLHEEIRNIMAKWEHIYKNLHNAMPPTKLLSELDKTSSILRDLLNDTFTSIVVDDKEMHVQIKEYLKSIAPNKVGIVKLHPSNSRSIFEQYGVTKQIKSSFGKTATMNSGAYLVVDHTEAMHVIDVNSGNRVAMADQESNALAVNMEAAVEIARQLRLRDLGGLIMVDFIDMKSPDNRKKVFDAIRDAMKRDTAKHTILPLSKFGILQITRQRVRPEVNITTAETCTVCKGTGVASPSILVIDEIVRDLEFIIKGNPKAKLTLETHQFIYSYLVQGFPSVQMKWWWKYKKWISLKKSINLDMLSYKFYDGQDEEIRLT